MDLPRRILLRSTLSGLALASSRSRAQTHRPIIRLGVLTDLSGQNASSAGPLAVACAEQAVADFAATNPGFEVEVVAADHKNTPIIGDNIARKWFDDGVIDAIGDLSNSNLALSVSKYATIRNKVVLNTGAVSVDLFGKDCSPNLVDWALDSWMLAHSTAIPILRRGGRTWFFISPDYALGATMIKETARVVALEGGSVVGTILYPFPGNVDFNSFLLKARASDARVIGLLGPGQDLERCVKQANAFGLKADGIQLAALVGMITNIKSLGLKEAQGLLIAETFYWDLNDRTRAFTRRLQERAPLQCANSEQAALYSAVTHYLKAVADIGISSAKASGAEVIAAMKRIPVEDDAFGAGRVRPDGRKIQPVYQFQVKRPDESMGEWDLYKLVSTIPSELAYRPMEIGGCTLLSPGATTLPMSH